MTSADTTGGIDVPTTKTNPNSRRWMLLAVVTALSAFALTLMVEKASAAFSFPKAGFGLTNHAGEPVRQAGDHPNLTNFFEVSGRTLSDGTEVMEETPKDIAVDFPPGLVIDPTVTPTCARSDVAGTTDGASGGVSLCPPAAQVGTLSLTIGLPGNFKHEVQPVGVYNVKPPPGVPGRFAANVGSVVVNFDSEVRPNDHYAVTAVSRNTSETLALWGAKVEIWGVAYAPENEPFCKGSIETLCLVEETPKPMISAPSDCAAGPLRFAFRADSWQSPGIAQESAVSQDPDGRPFEATGCQHVDFRPALELSPQTREAGVPSGVDVELAIPQNEDAKGLSTALLKKATVYLPKGMTLNSAAAQGAAGCSLDQIGLGNTDPARCPQSATIGTVEIDTPLLERPMKGSVYLAQQNANPFNSLLAMYVVAEGSGVVIKLPGKITADPVTGQMVTTFDENPQQPFNILKMHLNGGSRAPLVTPSACGTYRTRAEFTSWSQPEKVRTSDSTFTIDQNCGRQDEFSPGFEAGTIDPSAGGYSPFVLRLTRPDGQQNIGSLEAKLPKGLLARLAGIPLCSDAQAATADCPAASQVGATTVGTGSGTAPVFVPEGGKAPTAVYLAGPYKGGPYSLVVKVPAEAGPFNLGTVAVRNALYIDPETAQVTAKSDPLPQILQGIPISYRDIRVEANRSKFTLNPTSCDPMQVTAAISSAQGANASLQHRFQAVDCAALGFKPKLALRFSGAPTRRGGYPKLTATLTMPKGGANIRKAVVTMPKTQFLENAHIRTICTRVQWAAKACPAASVYGYAKAWTPLLDEPLQGPVYLRSSSNKLPDLVADLDGQIEIELAGRIDSVKERIRNTFWTVPDAAVSKFQLTMQGGRKGLLVNNTNLCKTKPIADVRFDGHNGKIADSKPRVKVAGCGKSKKKRQGL